MDTNQLPRIKYLFASLSGGRQDNFWKQDVDHAYQHIDPEEKSKNLFTVNTHKGLFRYNPVAIRRSSSSIYISTGYGQPLTRVSWRMRLHDNSPVTEKTEMEQLENREEIRKRLQAAGVYPKKAKSAFLLPPEWSI